MGLIKAAIDATRTSIGDQFKEFVTCPSIEKDVIIQRGLVNHGNDNKTFSEGVISNGSGIEVPQGMAMMIIDNGKIVEFTADPGLFKYDTSSEPSVFTGGLGKGIIDTIKTIGSRITYGGQPAKDQRVYYVNIKTISGFPFGSQQPEIIQDPVYESVEITYNGEYSIKVNDPVILINEIIGSNPKDTLTYNDIFSQEGSNQLKTKFTQKVSEAIASIMIDKNVSFRQVQKYKSEVTDTMNDLLDEDWGQKYGIIVQDVSLNINASQESKQKIMEMDSKISETRRMGEVYGNNMTGTMAAATGEAMKEAAGNANGALAGFVGLGAVQNAGGSVLGTVIQNENNKVAETETAPAGNTAGATSFCSNCGSPVNGGNFCTNCGNKLN